MDLGPSKGRNSLSILKQPVAFSLLPDPITKMPTTTPDPNPPPGLVLSSTEPARSFLVAASQDHSLSQQLRDLAAGLASGELVPYKPFRSVWAGSDPSTRPDLAELFSGSRFLFTSPKPREKSEELQARLRKLEELAERKAYKELVKDISPRNDEDHEPFSSYKDQLGFGMHVALIMFTGYLVGYATFRALFGHTPALSAAGGILGLVFGMLVETLLFIIRTTSRDSRPKPSASATKKDQ